MSQSLYWKFKSVCKENSQVISRRPSISFKGFTYQGDNICHQRFMTLNTLLEDTSSSTIQQYPTTLKTSSFWRHPLSLRIQCHLLWIIQSKKEFLPSSSSRNLIEGSNKSTQVSISMTSFESVKMTYCKESKKLVGSSTLVHERRGHIWI